jgi:hypothetical protein
MFQFENLTLQIIQSLKPLVEKVGKEDKNLADERERSAPRRLRTTSTTGGLFALRTLQRARCAGRLPSRLPERD